MTVRAMLLAAALLLVPASPLASALLAPEDVAAVEARGEQNGLAEARALLESLSVHNAADPHAAAMGRLTLAALDAAALAGAPGARSLEALQAARALVEARAEAREALGGGTVDEAEVLAALDHAAAVLSAVEAAGTVADPAGAVALARTTAALPLAAPRGALPPVPAHATLEEALAALLAAHGREPTEQERADVAALSSLPAQVQSSLRMLVDAHLFQLEATQEALATGDLDLLVAARGPVLDAVLKALPGLAATDLLSTGVDVEVCGVLAIDVRGVPSVYTCDVALLIDLGGNDVYLQNAGGASGVITPTPGNPGTTAALALDLAGQDRYVRAAIDPGAVIYRGVNGGAALGSGMLLDLGGNDLYTASSTAPQAAINGAAVGDSLLGRPAAGFLLDAGGRDTYVVTGAAGGAQNGAGADGGQGYLLDVAGDDRYEGGERFTGHASRATVNGAGGPGRFVGGRGMLLDLSGNDRYEGKATGAAVNGAATHVGAYGLLLDGAGNDVYRAHAENGGALNGAGASAVGILLDGDGSNVFNATANETSRYTPAVSNGAAAPWLFYGSAIHQDVGIVPPPGSVGILVGGTGDDQYEGVGVTQAASDFYSLALLSDAGGANSYEAAFAGNLTCPTACGWTGLAQGAGRNLGVGLLLDRGSSADFTLGDGLAGQGAGVQGVGLVSRPPADGATRYTAGPDSFPSALTGAGSGLRIHGGGVDLEGLAPEFECDATREMVSVPIPALGPEENRFRVCAPGDESREEAVVNPLTGNPTGNAAKPAVPCDDSTPCEESVTLLLGDDAPAWLRSDHVTTTTAGGFAMLSGSTRVSGVYHVMSADNSCEIACAALATLPPVAA